LRISSCKRVGLLLIYLALSVLLSACIVKAMAEEFGGTITGVAGWGASLEDGIIAFSTFEYDVGDLNGDGDSTDSVVRYYDIILGTVTNTGAIGSGVSIDGHTIAFATSEREIGMDLNGDRDTEDSVIRYYDILTRTVRNTGVVGLRTGLVGDAIAFWTLEQGTDDLNGDGDTEDMIISFYSISKGEVTVTGIVGLFGSDSFEGSMIAFTTSEGEAGIDLNHDGDKEDSVIRYYDLSSGVVTNTEVIGESPCLSRGIIAFSTSEAQSGIDLNGDGDKEDYVFRYYNTSSSMVTNTRVTGLSGSLDGDVLAFDRWVDERRRIEIGCYELSSGTVTWVAVGGDPSLDDNIIAFSLWEQWFDRDLNKDGDAIDSLMGYFVIGVDQPIELQWQRDLGWGLILMVTIALLVAIVLLYSLKLRKSLL